MPREKLTESEKVERLRAAGYAIGKRAGALYAGSECWKCSGRGYISAFAGIAGGICFSCEGHGKRWRPVAKAYSIHARYARMGEKRAAAEAARAEREAAERAANGGKTLAELAAEKAAAEKAAAEAAKLAAELAEKAKSEFLGEVGERIELVVTVEHVSRFESRFGPGAVVMLRAGASAVRWFTGSPGELGAPEAKGKAFKIVGTVKKHETFREERMTHLTRVKVLAEVAEPAEAAPAEAPVAETAAVEAPVVKVVRAAPPTCESRGEHLSEPYPLYDVAGIYVTRACAKCEAKVKSRYNPWVFEGPYSRYAGEIADHGERIDADY